ncbi:MAG: hypothetical protein CM1200mP41_11510 [Gammaproteobacteria bacterium]|nr:MAG: hypothetical protein CM1200mP41_11510 [Gammaproteobacteria bacterium]
MLVAASGSGGTLAAGDYLKQALGTRTGVVEALECPTLLYNGYGEHNIQGIGDKHVPLIHNVFNTDFVIGIPDAASDGLNLLFNTTGGQSYLTTEKQFDPTLINSLRHLGLSAIANILASIKLAKYPLSGAADAVSPSRPMAPNCIQQNSKNPQPIFRITLYRQRSG